MNEWLVSPTGLEHVGEGVKVGVIEEEGVKVIEGEGEREGVTVTEGVGVYFCHTSLSPT